MVIIHSPVRAPWTNLPTLSSSSMTTTRPQPMNKVEGISGPLVSPRVFNPVLPNHAGSIATRHETHGAARRRTPLSPLPQKKIHPQWGRSKATSAIDPSLPEAALLMVEKITERVDEMEVRDADQKVSLGDTITWLCCRICTLESGSRLTIPLVVGGAGNVYVTYPVRNSRDYIDRTTLDSREYATRAELPAPSFSPRYPTDLVCGWRTPKLLS